MAPVPDTWFVRLQSHCMVLSTSVARARRGVGARTKGVFRSPGYVRSEEASAVPLCPSSALAAVAGFVMSTAAQSSTVYVAASGSNSSSSCAQSSPCATLTYALANRVNAGGTVPRGTGDPYSDSSNLVDVVAPHQRHRERDAGRRLGRGHVQPRHPERQRQPSVFPVGAREHRGERRARLDCASATAHPRVTVPTTASSASTRPA